MDSLEIGSIGSRLDRLPATARVWQLVALISLGGFFENYDLFFTGYIAPGLFRDHIITPTTLSFFGQGLAAFIASLFAGLFIGTIVFGFVADKFGRRTVFTCALLWYSVASVIMAFQTDATGLYFWRFVAGVGIGVELVTIDTYISELVPKSIRGRAFAFYQAIQFSVVPIVAFLSYKLVPIEAYGFSGWRWVVVIGSVGAVVVWFIRLGVPESPRWLAAHGRMVEADRITTKLEMRVAAQYGAPLPAVGLAEQVVPRGSPIEILRPPYLGRTIMLSVFNAFQAVGFYGFANWMPTLLIQQGITVTSSLLYTFIIAIAAPFGPLMAMAIADKVERKWLIIGASGCLGVFGILFSQMQNTVEIVICGILITISANILSVGVHSYQAELYPTRVRSVAVGFVFSFSRLSSVFSTTVAILI